MKEKKIAFLCCMNGVLFSDPEHHYFVQTRDQRGVIFDPPIFYLLEKGSWFELEKEEIPPTLPGGVKRIMVLAGELP